MRNMTWLGAAILALCLMAWTPAGAHAQYRPSPFTPPKPKTPAPWHVEAPPGHITLYRSPGGTVYSAPAYLRSSPNPIIYRTPWTPAR